VSRPPAGALCQEANQLPALQQATELTRRSVGSQRFNEVLEKAEFVRLKLVEAQKQLPEDHPGHPSNHTSSSKSAVHHLLMVLY